MDNKYYTPKSSDLFEGYEFEYQEYDYDKDEYTDQWIEMKFDSRAGLGHDLTHTFNESRVRVPFLTREQIAIEGWLHEGGHLMQYSKQDYILGQYKLEYRELNQNARIFRMNHIRDGSDRFDWHSIFEAKILTINELRTLMRWFNIKKQ